MFNTTVPLCCGDLHTVLHISSQTCSKLPSPACTNASQQHSVEFLSQTNSLCQSLLCHSYQDITDQEITSVYFHCINIFSEVTKASEHEYTQNQDYGDELDNCLVTSAAPNYLNIVINFSHRTLNHSVHICTRTVACTHKHCMI